jgi:hypothetical protein
MIGEMTGEISCANELLEIGIGVEYSINNGNVKGLGTGNRVIRE